MAPLLCCERHVCSGASRGAVLDADQVLGADPEEQSKFAAVVCSRRAMQCRVPGCHQSMHCAASCTALVVHYCCASARTLPAPFVHQLPLIPGCHLFCPWMPFRGWQWQWLQMGSPRQGGSWLQLVEAVYCISMTGFCKRQFVAGLDVGNVFLRHYLVLVERPVRCPGICCCCWMMCGRTPDSRVGSVCIMRKSDVVQP